MKSKLDFFGKNSINPESHDYLITYILSLLDTQSLGRAARVSKDWNTLVTLTRRYLDLLPTIRRIPCFNTVGLDVLRLKLLAGGMTNTTYKVGIRSMHEEWVLRIPGEGSSAFIAREDEAHNALQAEKLEINVPVPYFDPVDGLQLTRFVDGVKLDEEALARKDILHSIAAIMRRLHCSKPFPNKVTIFERNEELLQVLKDKKFPFSGDIGFIEAQMGELKKLFSAYHIEMRPCHNDATPLNFILSFEGEEHNIKIKLHMIDWEYSSSNDLIWDLVYFALEGNLSQEQTLILLSSYFDMEHVPEAVLAWVEIYKPIIEWWITIWSWTQMANKANAVGIDAYKELGETCYKKTLIYLNSEEYKSAFSSIEDEKAKVTFSGHRAF
ncbi:phosphotransferase family protein [Legionella maioricensis]|uniref:Phosphotransferase n=1 Tax=Legionella maioricensis TaxID=2896528 RepID=A0A9X2D0L9_9GAMM|nr:phosphotransferase family protein [Legionella maioricensis]MCL9684226.1 phosphotransferase [Legionella maioricensis]MCL9687092.1 phosphotransferase [Legionella maioricensis]